MILALDVGNSQIYGGLFDKDKLVLRFRQSSQQKASSDELGLFLRQVLKENNQDPAKVEQVAICSVVPSHTHALKNCCIKYFDLNPFLLQAGVKTGLKIKYRNPLEVGADRIANAIAISHLYPNEPIIAVDLGTATTFDVISGEKEYLGGAIMPGLRLSMESLEAGTAKLPVVEIVSPEVAVGRSTVESIQSGLFYGHLGAMREFIARISKECFRGEEPKIIGTGGFANLFQKEKVFHAVHPDLVLKGLYLALKMNI